MNERLLPSLRDTLARAAVPLAAWAAMAVFAARELDPAVAAEGGYLALLAAAVLLAAAALAPPPALEAGLGAVLAAAAVWSLPPGPGRGAALVLLLAAALAVAAARRLARVLPELPFDAALPLALGAQFLLRGDLLFAPTPEPRTLVALLALPLAGAAALAVLARRHGGPRVLVAAGVALLLAPGWNVASTLAFVALAAGDLLARPGLGRPARGAALLVLLAPIAWEPGPGLAAAAAGLALAWPRLALALSVPLAAGLLFAWPETAGGWLARVLWLPLLVPAGLFLPERDRLWLPFTAVLLAAAVPPIPDLAPLAAPLALAALAQRSEGAEGADGADGAGAAAQRLWTGALFFGATLLAAYPWFRPEPLAAVLDLLGLRPGLAAAALAAGAFLLLAALAGLRPRFAGWQAAAAVAAALFLALLLHLPPPGTRLLPQEIAVVVDAAHPVWEAPLGPEPVGIVILESSLSNSSALESGTPVAAVRLQGQDGRERAWTVRAGQDTGEWAARRPDVERTSRLKSPAGWISWVAGDFFGQRYRAWWRLAAPGRFARLRIERAPALPADLSLAVHQVEVRP